MNFRLIALASCVALGSISLGGTAQAQTSTGGAVTAAPSLITPATCTVSALTALTLERTPGLKAVQATAGLTGFGTTGTTGTLTVTCASGGVVYANPPVQTTTVAGFNPAVRQTMVQLGTSASFTTASQGGNFDGGAWTKSAAPIVIPAGGTPSTLTVGMIAGTNTVGTAPGAAYGFSVSVTAVPN